MARLGEKVSAGTARLESDSLIFRGAFRLVIPFKSVRSISAFKGRLQVKFPEGVAVFDLGSRAAGWAEKILHPKSLLDKLGVKFGAAVSVLGVGDAGFLRQLARRTSEITQGKVRSGSEFVFFGAEKKADLQRLPSLAQAIQETGAIWVVYPKGQPRIAQADVMAAGKQAGLVAVKVASFSARHTALKFVIPVSRR
jgi:hypothetical protein